MDNYGGKCQNDLNKMITLKRCDVYVITVGGRLYFHLVSHTGNIFGILTFTIILFKMSFTIPHMIIIAVSPPFLKQIMPT